MGNTNYYNRILDQVIYKKLTVEELTKWKKKLYSENGYTISEKNKTTIKAINQVIREMNTGKVIPTRKVVR